MSTLPEAYFPEDLTREEYIAKGGRGPTYDWRKMSFAEHLADMRSELLSERDPNQIKFTYTDIVKAIDQTLLNVQMLIEGDAPTLAKFALKRYAGQLVEHEGKSVVVSIERHEPVRHMDYYNLVNN